MSKFRKKLIAGNWKMNVLPSMAEQLVNEILDGITNANCDILFIPPFTHIPTLSTLIHDKESVFIGAQNCHYESSGAFTGEISPEMLKDLNVDFVVLGHSERRQYFGENDKLINQKIKSALSQNLKVIYCCGESISEREAGKHKDLIEMQISAAFSGISELELSKIVIAYEPIWAIGTGKTASPDQAQDMHNFIRVLLSNMYSESAGEKLRILYGGSVKGSNAQELLNRTGIDGALVGGASLKVDEFCKIIGAAG
ncbi:MAG: triose-phosphate isomerase [Saprospirales bacterium]|nr:MAG: triose-phosphate isomerase [Saprospirales bacterium]